MSARQIAFRVLSRVERDGAYSNITLMHEFGDNPDVEDADRRLATELVYGTLRNRRYIDEWIDHLSNRPAHRIDPAVRRVLRLAIYQLLYLDRIPSHAVLSEAGRLLRRINRKHAVSFVNAMLRSFLREQKAGVSPVLPTDETERLAIELSIPDWLMIRWRKEISGETDNPKKILGRLRARAEQLNKPAPLTIIPNPDRISREACAEKLETSGVKTRLGDWSDQAVTIQSGGFSSVAKLVAEGSCHVMDEAAQLVVALLDPKPGERVLDLCAAPGGKSLMIAGQVGPEGQVVSVDKSGIRLGLLEQQAQRHGYDWLRTLAADVRFPVDSLEPASFDRVLVDAPCSALGVIRRHPEIRWKREKGDIPELAKAAREIVMQATHYVKPGGVLVFSVCTTTHEEGADQLRHVVAHTGWTADHIEKIDANLWKQEEDLHWIDTEAAPDLDGFFACRLRRPGA